MTGLILASQSASRRAMLDAAGVTYVAQPAAVDEAAITAAMAGEGADQPAIALALARAKALAVAAPFSTAAPAPLVLGSDSMIQIDGRSFDKPRSRDEAAAHLRAFSGRTIRLSSAATLARAGAIVWEHVDGAELQVRPLSDAFIAAYLDAEWPAIAGCVGCFRIEARGVQLFEAIRGSHFTILGMPLLAVLAALRDEAVIL